MDSFCADLHEAFADYRQDLEAYERSRRPADGLLGFGRTMANDPCHDRLDEKVKRAAEGLRAENPPPESAEEMVRLLLLREDLSAWPVAAQWMIRALERHALPLIPFLTPETAGDISRAYEQRYRRWERLPVQKQLCRALQERSRGK